jgi:hypothetical protein
MWESDSNFASVVGKDLQLWERNVDRLQRLGGFEGVGKAPAPFRQRWALGTLGRLYTGLGHLGLPATENAL